MRLKDAASVNSRKLPETTDPAYSFRYIDVSAVDSNGHIDKPDDLVSFDSAPSRARRLACPGDTIISTVRTYLRTVARVPDSRDPLVFSTGFAVLSSGQNIDPVYLYYLCRSESFLAETVARSNGVSYPAINPDVLADIAIDPPPIDQQRRIAEFLDNRVAGLDRLILRLQTMKELIEERRFASIRSLLSGGCSGKGEKSRVPWLESHPEHWDTVPLRYLARPQRGASPRPIDDPKYFEESGAYSWVRISDVTASGKYLRHTGQRLSALGQSRSVRLEPGELFVSIAGSVGKPTITTVKCCIHDGFVALRNPSIEAEYLYYVLILGDAFAGLGKLGTQLNLNSDTIGAIIAPIPPAIERKGILSQLRHADDFAHAAERIADRQLELLAERKRALITAAVTGQIDVTTAHGARD